MNQSLFSRVLLSLLFLFLSSQAKAILLSNKAFVDLTSIQVIPIAGAVSLSFTPSFNVAETQVNSDGDLQFDPSSAYSALASATGFVEASALADATLSAALTSAVDESAYASALAWHELQYEASGTGQVEVRVGYQIEQKVLDFSPGWDGLLYALVELLDEYSGSLDFSELLYGLRAGDAARSQSGYLSLILDVQDGQRGYLLFTALADAVVQSVPAPSTIALVLPLLLSLLRGKREVDHARF